MEQQMDKAKANMPLNFLRGKQGLTFHAVSGLFSQKNSIILPPAEFAQVVVKVMVNKVKIL